MKTKNLDLKNCEYKLYKVPIIGGINRYYYVKAPNKTLARMIANGQTNPWVKVKGKIVEVKENEENEKYWF